MLHWFVVIAASFAAAPAAENPSDPQAPLAPLPPRPERPRTELVQGCEVATGMQAAQPAPCTGTLVPVDDVAHLLLIEAWGDAIEARYQVDTAYLQWQVDQARAERDWYSQQLEETQLPWHQRPAVQRAIGGATVLVSIGVAGLMLHGIDSI